MRGKFVGSNCFLPCVKMYHGHWAVVVVQLAERSLPTLEAHSSNPDISILSIHLLKKDHFTFYFSKAHKQSITWFPTADLISCLTSTASRQIIKVLIQFVFQTSQHDGSFSGNSSKPCSTMASTSRSKQPTPSGCHSRQPDSPQDTLELHPATPSTSSTAHTCPSQASDQAIFCSGDLQERVLEEVGPQREEEQRPVEAHEVRPILGCLLRPWSWTWTGWFITPKNAVCWHKHLQIDFVFTMF